MSNSKIEWTERCWHPWIGCTRVSPGCKNCYAGREEDTRFRRLGRCLHDDEYGVNPGVLRFREQPYFFRGPVYREDQVLQRPLHWRKPRMIFVGSRTDIFHEDIPFEQIDRLFAVMGLCPQHTFQILTKRPRRMFEYFRITTGDDERMACREASIAATRILAELGRDQGQYLFADWPLPNVWLGVTAEDQERADERVPFLLKCPAAVRFVSHEPALGPVDLVGLGLKCPRVGEACGTDLPHPGCTSGNCLGNLSIDWLITGAESGKDRRPMDLDWARDVRDQCKAAGVPLFVKQLHIDGKLVKTMEQFPHDLRIREMPEVRR